MRSDFFREVSKTEHPQPPHSQAPLRKSFLPYTESSQYDDDDEEEENAMSRSQNHFSTVHFKPILSRQSNVATISDRPFAGCGAIPRLTSPPPLEPRLDEHLTLSVSNFLLSLEPSSPQHVSSKSSTIVSVAKQNHHEYMGCFRAFLRLFLKDEDSVFCQAVEGKLHASLVFWGACSLAIKL